MTIQESGNSSFMLGSGSEAAFQFTTIFMTCPIRHLSLNLQRGSQMLKPHSKLHFHKLKPNAGLTLIQQENFKMLYMDNGR